MQDGVGTLDSDQADGVRVRSTVGVRDGDEPQSAIRAKRHRRVVLYRAPGGLPRVGTR
jgi:hypothetical protein